MLEIILFAILSQPAQDLFGGTENAHALPQIEIFKPSLWPQKVSQKVAPKLIEDPRTAILAIDTNSGKTLLNKNADRPQYIASLSKLMTALIILENHELDEVVTIPFAATKAQGSQIELYEYEKLTIKTLLEALLIPSANDAAVALALYHEDMFGVNFVDTMNEKAKSLGLHSAQFLNPTGLDITIRKNNRSDETKVTGNIMSARDITKLARILLKYDFVREIVSQKHFYGTSVDEEFFHEKASTNELLDSFLNITGLKTGFTNLAGQCFVALGTTNEGNEIITVILGSEDRFGETKNLISWIYDAYTWK